jgi:putative SOS response-associated peptidase YedK
LSIITTEANALVRQIHGRMPVILRQEDEEKWLEEKNLQTVLDMLRPYDAKDMGSYEIADLVNAPGNDIEKIAEPVNREPTDRKSY